MASCEVRGPRQHTSDGVIAQHGRSPGQTFTLLAPSKHPGSTRRPPRHRLDEGSHDEPIHADLRDDALWLALGIGPIHASPATTGHAPPPFAGHWEADLKGDGKIHTFVFDFTVRGDSLGGTVSIASREGEYRVAGTVKGNHIPFEQFGLWDGAIEKSELKLTRGLDGGKVQHRVAHRATPR